MHDAMCFVNYYISSLPHARICVCIHETIRKHECSTIVICVCLEKKSQLRVRTCEKKERVIEIGMPGAFPPL